MPFSVSNVGATSAAPHESDSLLFSVVTGSGTANVPLEADSLPFSALLLTSPSQFTAEANSIPFSICAQFLGNTCAGYKGLNLVSGLARCR